MPGLDHLPEAVTPVDFCFTNKAVHFGQIRNHALKCLIRIVKLNLLADKGSDIATPVFDTDGIITRPVDYQCRDGGHIQQFRNGLYNIIFMDGVVNAALLKLLLGNIQSPWPQIARICAIIKFALIAVGLTYVIIGGLFKWVKRAGSRA